MISKIVKFLGDELKHVYVRKLEQKKMELEYEIKKCEKLSKTFPDMFFDSLQNLKKSHSRIEYQLFTRKEAWKIE